MGRIIEKVVAVFLLCVFLGLLINHGSIDFTLWDKTTEATKNAVESDQGQELIEEAKETAWNLADVIIKKLKEYSEEIKEANDNSENTSTKDSSNSKTNGQALEKLEKVKLEAVVDGDTLTVFQENRDNYKIRLIGIDTPESVNPDESKNNKYGDMASDYTKSLLEGLDELYIQYDTTTQDNYGRDLCYVWLKNDIDTTDPQDIANYMLNGILVRNGYAYNKEYLPNIKYADIFLQLREEAQNSKAGLWQYKDFWDLW